MDQQIQNMLSPYQKLSTSEYQVLNYMIEHINTSQVIGIREVAKANFVSTSTVLRMCKKLGYSGYKEFMFYLQNKTKMQQTEKLKSNHYEASLNYFIDNYKVTLGLLNEEDISDFQKIIDASDSIFINGTGLSRMFVQYLSHKLFLLGKNVVVSQIDDSKTIFLTKIRHCQLMISISKSGETEYVLEKTNIAKSLGLQVVSFTNSLPNSLTELAEISFKVYDDVHVLDERSVISSFNSNMIQLIDIVFL
ncbi:MurR/RpiR family transcriptional regulator [Priestia aryabhattai]|uniref:MurR/RpiR family transcriptional regulator n=1 Tax=Priestia aryabhattai TaxID=412384 RepID=UPI002E21AD76|nr:MurR/RpiR family transcriptional regulator [Priestia aryabhattai]